MSPLNISSKPMKNDVISGPNVLPAPPEGRARTWIGPKVNMYLNPIRKGGLGLLLRTRGADPPPYVTF